MNKTIIKLLANLVIKGVLKRREPTPYELSIHYDIMVSSQYKYVRYRSTYLFITVESDNDVSSLVGKEAIQYLKKLDKEHDFNKSLKRIME